MSSLPISPVEKVSAEIKATESLRRSILSGALLPGSRITEQQLSGQMQLSRATVRSALHKLSTEGLITLKPYAGWSVVSLNASDVWELSVLRAALERTACMLVARNLSDAAARAVQGSYEALLEACDSGTPDEAAEADFALHKTIMSLPDNSRLLHHYMLVEQQVRLFIHSSDALLEEPAVVLEQHRPIVRAILDADAEAAGRLMEEHTLSEGLKLSNYLRSLETTPA